MRPIYEQEEAGAIVAMCILICALIFLVSSCNTANAEDYTDVEIVNAIRKAEGTWTYGIKSIKCETTTECRKICFNTVRNNRTRYARTDKKQDYISFLAKRYCPVGAENDPTGLNKNWEKNVRYFLNKGRTKNG